MKSDLIRNLRSLFVNSHYEVSDIEPTYNNYDDSGSKIQYPIPTITTDLCEIGVYDNICYFTIILKSKSLTKNIFDGLASFNNVHIYGLKNFQEDYYPKEGFSYDSFNKQILLEDYSQIQFNFDIRILSPTAISEKYEEIRGLFSEANVKVVNQLTQTILVKAKDLENTIN